MSSDNKKEIIIPQLTKAINNLISWEKEKEQILFQQNNNINEKKFYLIRKEWMNAFKSSIKYKELIKNYKKAENNEEEIISEFIKNNLKNLEISLFNYENQSNEDKNIIISLIIENNFKLDIINEELFKSFFTDEQKGFQISGF